MTRLIKILCITISIYAQATVVTVLAHDGEKHNDNDGHNGHSTKSIDVSKYEHPPEIKIEVIRDSVSGWNVRALVKNFKFTPSQVNNEYKEGEGHAHLYINGDKFARMYSEWFHLPHLEIGTHIVSVHLNANDHRALVNNKIKIMDHVVITQQ